MARLNSICDGNDILRILFLYNADWSKEVRDYERGIVPSHRLFGLAEMRKLGHTVSICPTPRRRRGYLSKPIAWRIYQAFYTVFHQRHFDALIATHEAAALPLLLFKRLALLRTPMLVISVALLHPRNEIGKRRWMWRFLLPAADTIVSYANEQVAWIAAAFSLDERRLAFVHLGVDIDFFPPSYRPPPGASDVDRPADAGHCISVGTNEGKDFPTLLAALPATARLTIVTDAYNSRLIRESAHIVAGENRIQVLQDVPIDRLRTLYGQAAVHVIPLLESKFSSGQTVLLENMALGKTVIVSDTSGVRDYIENETTAIVVRPGDTAQLNEKITAALADPSRCRAIGERAGAAVKERYSALATARKLLGLLEKIVPSKLDS